METTSILPIAIMPEAYKIMENHAQFSFPDECVGFIFGFETGQKRIITRAIQTCNVKEGDKRRRFEISPLSYMKAEKYALQHDLTFLGIYHSHPLHPAVPSAHDLKQAMPFFSYPILSITPGEKTILRSWQLTDEEKFAEEFIPPYEQAFQVQAPFDGTQLSIH